jgi:WD40 repeat protein
LISFLVDARYFVAYFTAVIQKFPLQLYNSALMFSPVESKIRRLFWKEVPAWIKKYPNVPEDWATVDGKPFHKDDHSKVVHGPTAMSFSPNMEILANAWGRQVDLWDVESRKLLGTIGHGWGLQSTLAFSPNCEFLATVSIKDNAIILWNPETRELRASLKGHSAWIRDVVFTTDSKTLASASGDFTIRSWDIMTGKCYAIFEGHSGWVSTLNFSPDGRTLASGSYDTTARLWDVGTGELRQKLMGHLGWINSVVFSPDGQILATASLDQTIRLWDPVTGQCIGYLKGHQGSVSALVFSQNCKFVASLAKTPEDRTIRLWDIDTRETVQVIDSDRFLFQLSFSDDGSKLETNRGRH